MYTTFRHTARIDVRRRARLARVSSIILRALCVCALLCAQSVYAQSNARVNNGGDSDQEKLTFWLQDENDSWRVPLPNWTLEDVMRMIDAQEETVLAPYSIQSVMAKGAVEDGLARLTINIDVEASEGTIRVPLGLSEGVYIPTPEQEESGESRRGGFSFEGPGFCTLDVDPKTGEYVAIIQSPTRRSRRRQPNREQDNIESAPEQTVTPAPTEPVEPAPAEPVETAPVEPVEPAPAEPVEPAPAEPVEPAPAEPVEPAPAEPVEPVPAEPVEPALAEPVEPAPTEPVEPAPAEPVEPSPAEPVEPAPAEPVEPAPAEPVEPAPEEPAAPAPEEPAAPAPEETSLLRQADLSTQYASPLAEPQEPERVSGDAVAAERTSPFYKYTLRLELCFAVEPIGKDEFRLVASFPAAAHSLLTLIAPAPDADISSVKGAVAATPNSLSATTTELKLHGLGKGGARTELVWQQRDAVDEVAYHVENALIEVTLAARETTYDATLPVRAFGGESNVFYVRLPDDSVLESESVAATGASAVMFSVKSANQITFEEIPEALKLGLAPEESSQDAFAEIQLEQASTSIVLKLRARARTTVEEASQEADASGNTPARLLAGFDVLGAQKQNGQVKITRGEGLDFDVTPSYGASRDPDALNAEGQESYSYYTQPFLLKAQAFRRQAIVNVKPEYQATTRLDGIELRARFKYSIYGMKASEVRLRLHDWKFKSDDANETLDLKRSYLNESSGEHVFPLKTPSDGAVVFELTFFREPTLDAEGALTFALPTPIADWVEPSALIVTPDNNVALSVLKERCVGLEQKSARSFSLELPQPTSTQTPLYFQARQLLSSGEDKDQDAIFCATLSKLEQEIDVTCATEASFSERGEFRVRQAFTYSVKNEALEEIAIQIPDALLKAKAAKGEDKEKKDPAAEDASAAPVLNVRYMVDGKAALATKREEPDDLGDERDIYVISLADQPKIGACVVDVQYEYQSQSLEAGSTNNRIDLFLIQPLETDGLRSNTLRITAQDPVSLAYNTIEDAPGAEEKNGKSSPKRFWRHVESGYSDDGVSWYMQFQSTMPETFIRFSGSLASEKQGAPIAERAWIQTWYSNAARFDSAFFRMRCEKSFLTVRLPDAVRQDRVAVSIDGKPFEYVSDPERGLFVDKTTLRIPVAEELRGKEFMLELSYITANKDLNAYQTNGRCVAQLPTFDKQTWVRRAYWQVIVPNDRHIVRPPRNWSPEYIVKRSGKMGFYSRVASLDTGELYEWIGVEKANRPDPAVQEANVYLYSSFSYSGLEDPSDGEIRPAVLSFYIAARSGLVLFGSGVALAIGLGLLYFPTVRSPSVLFILSVAALTASAYQPTLALIFLQTTVFGILLTLVTAIIAKIFGRRVKSAEGTKRMSEVARGNSEVA